MASHIDSNQTSASQSDPDSFSLDEIKKLAALPLAARVDMFVERGLKEMAKQEILYMREMCGPADREVLVMDPYTRQTNNMLMFGSNNYLGFANHPYIKKIVCSAIDLFGSGIGGPPMLNGTTSLHVELERRLAELKNTEAAVIFPTGYAANLGWVSALVNRKDTVLFDQYCHASFIDGLKINRIRGRSFKHNNIDHLRELLEANAAAGNDGAETFVVTEGVFSMDGDVPKLNEIIELKKQFGFFLVVDDAHGFGVLGQKGHGIQELFDTDQIDILVGTFSKALAVTGGFIAAPQNFIHYIRWSSRPYIFSASPPPPTIAAVLAALDLLEKESWRITQLHKNSEFLLKLLAEHNIPAASDSSIICIRIPEDINIRTAGKKLHTMGLFVNTIEYPAVPRNQQRIRISVMSDHTEKDMVRLVTSLKSVLNDAC